MCRQVRGSPDPILYFTWWADSGEIVQKSRCMLSSRRPLSARRFWEWIESWNFVPSRTKDTGVLLPIMS